MKAPPRCPDPITEDSRWRLTQLGAVLFVLGFLLCGVVWWQQWPAQMFGFPVAVSIVGGWMADPNKTRDFFRWVARTFRVPFIRRNGNGP